jgi:hypothetical protein
VTQTKGGITMAKSYTEWAKEIIDKVGTLGADKLMRALDLEIDKVENPEDYKKRSKIN